MPAKILIPSALRPYAGNRDAIEVPAGTVGEAMAGLAAQCPDLKKHLYTEDGRLRSFINVFVGDEDIRARQNEKTPVNDGDVISVIPSIAGGVLVEEAPADVELDNQEVARYSRHLIMPEVGMEGQKKLKAARKAWTTACPSAPSPPVMTTWRPASSAGIGLL
jgi:adenylyltransferase/sulfurtransferase